MQDVEEANKTIVIDDGTVEIDTGDEKETTVELQEDSSGKETIAVSNEAPDPENGNETEQEQLTNNAQKRINRLTKKMRDAEKKEQEAIRYAQQVQKESQELKQRMASLDNGYMQEFGTRIDVQTSQAEANLKRAVEIGDADQIVAAQKELSKLSYQSERFNETKNQHERQQQIQQAAQTQQPQVAPTAQPGAQEIKRPDPKAEAWAKRNEWFGTDEAKTFAAFGIHKKLVEDEGFDPTSNEYYTELDNRISSTFNMEVAVNDSGTSKRAAQTVAGVSRATGSSNSGRNRRVKLSPTQVAIAKKLGVPLEEYAKHVKE
jgi:hypothetical protein